MWHSEATPGVAPNGAPSCLVDSRGVLSQKDRARPHWRSIVIFYVLACAISWPFFWWRDVHPASWDAWSLPPEIKGLTQPWGPGLAALAVAYLYPRVRLVSLFGPSTARSAAFCLVPVVAAWVGSMIVAGRFSYSIVYYLLVGAFSTLGEEVGWRGFLQSALRPLGRIRGYLLLALLWEVWHFTSHTKGPLPDVISRLALIVPIVVVTTFVLGLVTERTGSLLIATTLHEWIDIVFDGSVPYLTWAALVSVPVWIWLVWTWPDHAEGRAPAAPG